MKKIIYILLIFFISCQNNKKQTLISESHDSRSQSLIQFEILNIDTLIFDNIESSYLGEGQIFDDTIYFVDSRFCWIFTFDKNGRNLNRYLGRGKGPKEIPTGEIDGFELFCDDSYHVFWDPGLRFMKFDKNFKITHNGLIDRGIKYSKKQRLKNTEPNMHGIYTFTHGRNLTRYYNGYIYTTIYSEYPKFNPLKKKYYEEARILAKISTKNGEIEDILGRYSSEYLKYKYVPQFTNVCYDISKDGNFYIGYEIDSLIYLTDENLKVIKTFGRKGKLINSDYLEINTITDFFNNYESEREKKGYYNWIEYIDELGVLCRTYSKGKESKFDGLQIYKNEELLADIEIPKRMKILGYIEPYIYSNIIINELDEIIKVYRIKIKE